MNDELTIKDDKTTINSFYSEELISYITEDLLVLELEKLAKSCTWFFSQHLNLRELSWNINVNFVDAVEIQEINNNHRSKNKPTDVLSFPMQDDLRSGEYDQFTSEIELGDLFICLDICDSQAQEHQLSFRQEMIHLFFHGFLHLCGFDHELSETEDKLMRTREEEILDHYVSLMS